MLKAPVNKIIAFSNVDGPGNRTSIFFQSCPFTCLYCHNPETINYCIHCGDCVKTCPTEALTIVDRKVVWNQHKCVDCDTCIKTCTHLSSPKIKMLSVDELMSEINKQKGFIRGITVSGGECMNHAEFLLELFKRAKDEGYTCLIDSNGYHEFLKYENLLEYTDGVMLDVKAVDNKFHEYLTGCSNEIVIKNLKYLIEQGKLEEVRTVLLPNDLEQNKKTVEKVASLIGGNITYKLLRYRPFGVRDEGIKEIGNTITTIEEAEYLKETAFSKGAVKTVVV